MSGKILPTMRIAHTAPLGALGKADDATPKGVGLPLAALWAYIAESNILPEGLALSRYAFGKD